MNCSQFQEWLQRFLDGESLEETGDLHLHLRQCQKCKGLYAAARSLKKELLVSPLPLVSPSFTESIVRAVLADQPPAPRLKWRYVAAMALAASALIALLIPLSIPRSASIHSGVAQIHMPSVPEKPTLKATMARVGNIFASWTSRTARETAQQAQLVVPPVSSPDLAKVNLVSPTFSPPTETIRETGNGMSRGLKPVTRSVQRAWNLFLGSGGSEPEAKKPEL